MAEMVGFVSFVFYHKKKLTGLDSALSSLLCVSNSQTAETHLFWGDNQVPASAPGQAGGQAMRCSHEVDVP